MRTKTILIGLFVASLAVLGAVLLRNARPVAGALPKTTILVAAEQLQSGTLLRAEDVRWQAWSGAVAPGAIVRPSEEDRKAKPNVDALILNNVYGGVVRQRVEAGQPIFSNLIVKPGDRGFLAAVLSPGSRAVDISVTAVSSAAGLIFPGDHVDVILTQSFTQAEEPLSRRVVGETIVSNLRVLAMDQRLQQATPEPSENGAQFVHTATLEVLPKQAEMISVASELGKLSLTLRNVPTTGTEPAATNGPAEQTLNGPAEQTLKPTWAEDVSPALKPEQRAAVTPINSTIHIIRGNKIEDVKD